jgi:hypothetical protein
MSSLAVRPGPLRATLFHAFLAAALLPGSDVAGAAPKADETGVLLAAGVVEVATRAQLEGTSYFKDLLAHGIAEDSIGDVPLVVGRLLCCRDDAKTSVALYLYNPLSIQVAPGDMIEVRIGDSKAKGTPEELSIVTRVLQRADQENGQCRWYPPDERLWMRFIVCDWMPAEGWVKRERKLFPGWYKPREVPPAN